MWNKWGIVIPGVVWGFILVGVGYFLQANFPNEVWMPLVVVLIGAILKFIEVKTGQDLPDLPPMPDGVAASAASSTAKKPNKGVRWLVG